LENIITREKIDHQIGEVEKMFSAYYNIGNKSLWWWS